MRKTSKKHEYKPRPLNYYHGTEHLLRLYPEARRIMEAPEEYDFFPKGKSKDISIAPPPGCGVTDKIEITENFIEGRKKAFTEYVQGWQRVNAAVKAFENDHRFFVIRMYYFGETYDGDPAPRKYSFEDIADELSIHGINRTVRCLRGWRTHLVQDIAVLIFGPDAALAVTQREGFALSPNDAKPE